VEFLKHLMRHISGPMILIWDRLPAHRSRMVQDFIVDQQGRIHTEYVPAYAPDLNPVEYLWGHWKQHELPNVCPKDWWELNERARRTLRKMRRRPRLIAAFWKQADLAL
jgi:transposase